MKLADNPTAKRKVKDWGRRHNFNAAQADMAISASATVKDALVFLKTGGAASAKARAGLNS